MTLGSMYLDNFVIKYKFDTESIPDFKTLILTIVFCTVVEDITFYCSHRTLHTKFFYPLIHKIHHQFITTISLGTEYAHPIEYAFGNLIPGFMPIIILGTRIHFFTFIVWIIYKFGEALDGHTGYDFSWSPYRLIPFSASASYHDYHHSHNVGNYSSMLTIWDSIFGTNKAYHEFYIQVE